MKNWYELTKKELLALPYRPWFKEKTYAYVLLVNTRHKHDSGYNLFAVIGVERNGNMEIAAYCDDFRFWHTNSTFNRGVTPERGFAFDCSMHGVFRLWSSEYDILVGCCTSTTDFSFIPRGQK